MKPEVGEWYRRDGIGEFEVITVDRDSDEIEIQLRSGDTQIWDIDDWEEADECEELTKLEEDPTLEEDDLDLDLEEEE